MPKRIGPLDRLNIASPCAADWDEMLGNEQVRLCQDCSRHVHDLSQITRKDALRLIAASQGRLCLRYYRRPDGTVHTAGDGAPSSALKRRLSRLAAGAFTASLSLASSAAARTARPDERVQLVVIQPAAVSEGKRPASPDGLTASLAGTVRDTQGGVIAGATVQLINDATGTERSAMSDNEGSFVFQDVEAGTYKLKITASGFSDQEVQNIVVQDGSQEHVDAILDMPHRMVTMGIVLVAPDTALLQAIWHEDMAEVRNLLAAGVDVNALDRSVNTTALAAAVSAGNLELVRMLIYVGADPNRRNDGGQTPLMMLDDDATVEIVRTLLEAGAKVNLKDAGGETALHRAAAATEKSEVVRALLDAGAKVNARTREGKTALMVAAEAGHADIVRALLWAGANVHRKNKDGATAIQLARENEHPEVVAALLSYGADD